MTTIKSIEETNQKLMDFEAWMLRLFNSTIGIELREYVKESNHSGWDGFTPSELAAIAKFLYDIQLYHKSKT